LQVFPVSSFTEDSSGGSSESDRLQRMKARIAQMEKDMRGIYALVAIIKKKGELAANAERYDLADLHKATKSLNCKYQNFMFINFWNKDDPLT
jgi:phage shock protein A